MAVAKYKDANGNVKKLSNVKVNLLDGLNDKFLITLENATISSNDNSVNGKTRALIKKDTNFDVVANEIDGKVYNYMKNARGEIVTYSKTYNTYARDDNFFEAIYSDNEIEAKSLINIGGMKGFEYDKSQKKITYVLEWRVIDEDEFAEWGVVFTPKDLSADELKIGGTGVYINRKTEPLTKKMSMSYYLSFSEGAVSSHTKVKTKGYIIVRHSDGTEETIYTRMVETIL